MRPVLMLSLIALIIASLLESSLVAAAPAPRDIGAGNAVVTTVFPIEQGIAAADSTGPPPSPSVAAEPIGVREIFFDDFDVPGLPNWQVTGYPTWDSIQFGLPVPLGYAWCAGRGGTILPTEPGLFDGRYGPVMDAWMIYGPFSLACTDTTTCRDAWAEFSYTGNPPAWDGRFIVWASCNKSTWSGIVLWPGQMGDDQSPGIRFALNNLWGLGNLCGKPQVWLAFYFEAFDPDPTGTGPLINFVRIKAEYAAGKSGDLEILDVYPAHPDRPQIPLTSVIAGQQIRIVAKLRCTPPFPTEPVTVWVGGSDYFEWTGACAPVGTPYVYATSSILTATEGSRNLYAYADCRNVWVERNETNNERYEYPSFSVGPAPTLTITSPAAGAAWQQGSTQTVRWNYTGSPGPYLRVELLEGGKTKMVIGSITPVGAGGSGSLSWRVPTTLVPGSSYTIRAISTTNPSLSDISDPSFSIVAPAAGLRVTTPNGGETWRIGTIQMIRWNYSGSLGPYVRVELVRPDGTVDRVVASAARLGYGGAGSLSWYVPSTVAPGEAYRIGVTSTSNGLFKDVSDGSFRIIR